jgi:soluble lytic murein transglycosylase-like protein
MKTLMTLCVAIATLFAGSLVVETSARAEDMRMEVESSSKAQKRNSFRREYRHSRYERRASRRASRHERRKPLAANPHPYGPMIASYAATHGVPVKLADAMVRIESRYNPRARNRANVGLTQISYPTAKSIGYSGSPAGLYEPSANLNYGIKYLAQAYKLAGGDTCRTIMKYQSGHRAVSMNGANRAYCAKVHVVMANY